MEKGQKTINIAIDGPAGAGKSTLSKMLASQLGYIYVDTGALYRTVGLYALRKGVNPKDAEKVSQLLKEIRIEIKFISGTQHVFLNDEDVSNLIRTPEVSMAASAVSAIPNVRSFLLDLQKDIAAKNNIIMDGRDIGTVILPNAQIKIFLTASPEIRAKRRFDELIAKGQNVDYQSVLNDIKKRDEADSGREIAPLKPAKDAIIVDTTEYNLEQSLELLIKIVKERLK
ncbi:Cytidylate kinase [[Clostridium] cellulosi]|uniref:Cytidylate kinase n=1 Tax=[Clostridium] cellulosi TaxID=29343 RepID=A0A078KP29_9FIRM|nr:Cytidylate kinase [[Clostridium] cellulosi]